MTIFTDGFGRADGALGGNWATSAGTPVIASGWVKNDVAGGGEAINTTITDQDYQRCTTRQTLTGATTTGGPIVMAASTTSGRYLAGVVLSSSVYYLRIYTGAPNTLTQLASKALASAPPSIFTLTLEWNAGTLTATIPDFDSVSVVDNTYANGLYMGIRAVTTVALIDSVTMVTGTATGLAIDPAVIGNFGECTEVTLTGTNTDWTDGTPGSPIFTVNHGTITSQSIDANVATLTYCPGSYLGTIIFTDPSTGDQVGALVTSDPALVNPTGSMFSTTAIEYIERSAAAEENGTIANREMVVSESGPSITLSSGINQIRLSVWDKTAQLDGDPGINALGDFLWKLLTNRNVQSDYAWNPTRDTSLKEDLEYLVNEWITVRTVNEYTLGDVIVQLAGEGVPTHKSIMDAVGELDAPDLQPVLDAIEALRGDAVSTVKALADQLDAIRTIGDYTLASVKTWVEAVRGTDQPTIKNVVDAIAALNNAPAADLEPVLEAVAGVDLQVVSILAKLVAFFVPELATVTTILDAIDAIEVAPAATGNAPIWPGLANVTLGTPVALATGTVIDGPMDGVLIHIDSAPSGAGLYLFGAVKSYTHAGSIMFGTDNGDWEFPAKIACEDHVICPRIMISAGTAKLRVNTGFTGTVTPWTTTL